MEHTLALIKPDTVAAGKAAEMQQLAELAGFQVVAKRTLQLTQHMAETFYEAQKGKPFYPGLVEFMTSGPVVALVLAKADAITGWREVMGPTDVFEARLKAPKCLRALFGSNATRNAAHGSDSPASAARDIHFFFPHLQLHGPPVGPAAYEGYIKALQPTLLKALSALAKEKPSSKPEEAVTFLATYLLQHNPLKPHVDVPPELAAQQLKQAQQAAAAAKAMW